MRFFRKPKPARPPQVWPVADEVHPQWLVEQWTGPNFREAPEDRQPLFLDALPKAEQDRLPSIESVCARLAKTLRNESESK